MNTLMRSGLLWLASGVVAGSAWACDCPDVGPASKAFSNTPTVFRGRVTRISSIELNTSSGEKYSDRLVCFEVQESFRGGAGKSAEVVTGSGGGDCGYSFREGVDYLVYAFPHPRSGKLYTGICQRTRPISEAVEDLEYLEHREDSDRKSGIEGVIEELRRDTRYETRVTGYMPGIRVVIEGKSVRRTVVTDKNGRFEAWGLEPGRYRVSPILPKGFSSWSPVVSVKASSCETVRFLATPEWKANK
jgi:hypothetical protein